jgi:hypothetical protein
MRQSIPYRRIIALAATYVVVLQALLLPLAVAAAAPMRDGLCLTSGANTSTPVQHDAGCGCAAGCGTQCCGQGLIGAAPASIAAGLVEFSVLTPAFALEAAAQAAPRGPQNPRAPPPA